MKRNYCRVMLDHQILGRLIRSFMSPYYMRKALKIAKKVENQILETPPILGSRYPNYSCQFFTHGRCHVSEHMLNACPNGRLDTIKILGCVA
jgi:hypothetical protein